MAKRKKITITEQDWESLVDEMKTKGLMNIDEASLFLNVSASTVKRKLKEKEKTWSEFKRECKVNQNQFLGDLAHKKTVQLLTNDDYEPQVSLLIFLLKTRGMIEEQHRPTSVSDSVSSIKVTEFKGDVNDFMKLAEATQDKLNASISEEMIRDGLTDDE